jgi:hypothetical protein
MTNKNQPWEEAWCVHRNRKGKVKSEEPEKLALD